MINFYAHVHLLISNLFEINNEVYVTAAGFELITT